ncbi:class I SAM-dependent methyltransferase [Streptomyces sp. Tue6028]|uniref:class I SAM-dependent methyltransferase n=1 Tax=Streptomyces sp. Tue6028 TaxID=2036037 RepID=UPI003D74E980
MSVAGATTGATTETDDMSPVPVAHWEELFAQGRGFRRADARELTLLAGHVRPVSGQRALDVGCGLGGYAAGLAHLGYRTVAVDWAQSSVAAVRDRYSGLEPGLTAHCVDFEDDDAVQRALAPGSFDLITMRLVLAFMTDKAAVAQRVRRLLAPAGVWLVTTPLAQRLPAGRRSIAVTAEDLAVVTGPYGQGGWYDLEQQGLRCIIMRS